MPPQDLTNDAPLGPPPERLGPFILERLLGAGATASVHVARLAEERPQAPIGSRVIVKVLHAALQHDETVLARFLREGRLGLDLRHERIVATLDVDAIVAGKTTWHVIVQEHAEGRSLRQVLDARGRLPDADVRRMGAQIAEGLAVLHAAGIVHRDLKPSNVLVVGDSVKLMDLGVAAWSDASESLTGTGDFVGSPRYAAPEQLHGGEVGEAADLHALGVILFEAATGTHPFADASPQLLVSRVLREMPARARAVDAHVSAFLEAMIDALLAKLPAERPAPAWFVSATLAEGESSSWWAEVQASQPHPSADRVLARLPAPASGALVGRREPLALLRGGWERAARGVGSFVLVEGEAGIGKSAVLRELVDIVAKSGTSALVLHGACSPGEAGLGGPILASLREHFGGLPFGVAASADDDERLRRVIERQASPSGGAPAGEAERRAAVVELAERLCERQPVLWILEDLHLADEDERRLVGVLGARAPTQRLMLVACTRSHDADRWRRLEPACVVPLPPLDADGVSALLRARLGSDAVAERLSSELSQRCDGNPMFVLELLRNLERQGRLRRQPDGRLQAIDPTIATAVPDSLRTLLLASLDALDDASRGTLDSAAVQGFRFDASLLADMLGERRLVVLQRLVALERRHGLVRAVGPHFEFAHHLVQEIALQVMPHSLRTECHVQLASALREMHGLTAVPVSAWTGEHLVLIAHHLVKGGARDEARALLPRALDVLSADLRFRQMLDLEPGITWIEDGESRLAAELHLAQAQAVVGDLQAQARTLERALAVARQLGSPGAEIDARLALASSLSAASDHAAAWEHAAAAARLATQAGDARRQARSRLNCGLELAYLGRLDEAGADLAAGEALACEVGDLNSAGRAACGLSFLMSHSLRFDEACEHARRVIEIADRTTWLDGQVNGHGMLASSLRALGRYDEACRHLEIALEVSTVAGLVRGQNLAATELAQVQIDRGDLAAARRLADGVLARPPGGFAEAIQVARLRLAEIEMWEGAHEEALRHLRASASNSGAPGPATSGPWLDCRAELDAAVGDIESAAATWAELAARQDGTTSFFHRPAEKRLLLLLEHSATVEAPDALHRDGSPLREACLAVLGRIALHEAVVGETHPIAHRIQAHLVLAGLPGGGEHGRLARALLESLSRHLKGPRLRQFWTGNRFAARAERLPQDADPAGTA